jgi:tetratricopeptide (TPR) repeat protein
MIGQLIDGRYRVVEVIGEGGMGLVYRAEQERLKRSVAIKVLQRDYSSIPEVGRRFEREAIAIARLDHPNCVAVQDFGRLPDGSLYLVMSYLNGTSLREAINEGPIPVARTLHIGRHILAGLAHAHNAGIVHRDVKPDNVMLVRHEGDPDFAKIFDFGIAKLDEPPATPSSTQLTKMGQRFGTPAYMSPEQAMGKPLDARTDLYSSTVVLFEMLTGRTPFVAADDEGLLVMHAAKAPPRLSELANGRAFPEELEELIARGLAKDPAQRWANASQLIDALDAHSRVITDVTLAAAVPVRRRPVRSMLRPLRSWKFVTRFALVLLIVAGAVGLSRALRVDHAARARALLASGRPQEAASYLEQRLKEIADDAHAQLELGNAYAAARRYDDALVAYERVRSLDRKLAGDRTMRRNLMLMIDDERNETATGSARFLIQLLDDEAARKRVVEIASRSKTLPHRVAMRDLAESLGLSSRVDRLTSLGLDLEQGATCADRQRSVAQLRALADPAAIPALKNAQALKKKNACLLDDAADAIRYLGATETTQAAPPAAHN